MVLKPADPSTQPLSTEQAFEESQSPAVSHSDLSYQINRALQTRTTPRTAHKAFESSPDIYRNEDSDSDWDASDREEGAKSSRHVRPVDPPDTEYSPPPGPPPHHSSSLVGDSTVDPSSERQPSSTDVANLRAATDSLQINERSSGQDLGATILRDRTHTNPFLRNVSGHDNRTAIESNNLQANSIHNVAQYSMGGVKAATLLEPGVDAPWLEAQTTGSLYDVSSANTSPPPPDTSPRSIEEIAAQASSAAQFAPSETPEQLLAKQENAFYSIKRIHWRKQEYPNSSIEIPILVQNANGPCPLLALVNALVLSTQDGEESVLVNHLRTRETISLGLLIDSIIDDLISKRRPAVEATRDLPDLSELYRFLVNLHTGMNVNPRFVPKDEPLIGGNVPGSFEQTRDVTLYSTFAIPILHGWIPDADEPAYAAFARSAPSYEDAQNLLFLEEDLDHMLSTQHLSPQDEARFMDLSSIKEFLARWRSQLTPTGLSVMRDSLGPNQIVILFRNDHFSTILKEPSSGILYSLVTDAGYAPHREIAFESLVDINGSQGNFFTGDYSIVNSVDENGRAAVDDSVGWTTVHRRPRAEQNPSMSVGTDAMSRVNAEPVPANGIRQSSSEQEDADLALAMQLQEEEEERQRAERAARRREEELSQRFLSQDSHQRGPELPVRRGPQTTSPTSARNGTQGTEGGAGRVDGDRLPTYEQAAAAQPFNPPAGHPASPAAPRQASALGEEPEYHTSRGRAGRRHRPGPSLVDQIPDSNTVGRSPYATTHEATGDRREGCVIM